MTALGGVGGDGVARRAARSRWPIASPPIRAAALRALAQLDPEGFVTILSGLDPDPHWSVRVGAGDRARRRCRPTSGCRGCARCWRITDQRVIPAVLAVAREAAARRRRPTCLLDRLKADDPVVRAAAARGARRAEAAGRAGRARGGLPSRRARRRPTSRAPRRSPALAAYGARRRRRRC